MEELKVPKFNPGMSQLLFYLKILGNDRSWIKSFHVSLPDIVLALKLSTK